MSIYPNVSKEDMIELAKLAEQQKNQRAIKIKKDSDVVWLRELVCCKDPIWADLLDTLENII